MTKMYRTMAAVASLLCLGVATASAAPRAAQPGMGMPAGPRASGPIGGGGGGGFQPAMPRKFSGGGGGGKIYNGGGPARPRPGGPYVGGGYGNHQHHHKHRRYRIYAAPYFYDDYYYNDYSYNDGGDCSWMWRRYLQTGLKKWKWRYYQCIE